VSCDEKENTFDKAHWKTTKTWLWRGAKKDKDRINVGVKWAKMTGDRTNISFAGRKNNFSYRKYDVRTMGERNNVLMSRNAFFN
jgi:hypothetical protein